MQDPGGGSALCGGPTRERSRDGRGRSAFTESAYTFCTGQISIAEMKIGPIDIKYRTAVLTFQKYQASVLAVSYFLSFCNDGQNSRKFLMVPFCVFCGGGRAVLLPCEYSIKNLNRCDGLKSTLNWHPPSRPKQLFAHFISFVSKGGEIGSSGSRGGQTSDLRVWAIRNRF